MSKIEYANVPNENYALQFVQSLFGGDLELSGGARAFTVEATTGLSLVFKGEGFDYDADGEPISGRAASCQIKFQGETVARITDLDVGAGKLAGLTSEKFFNLLGDMNVAGSKGDDYVVLAKGDDVAKTGDGDDVVYSLDGGGGDDRISLGGGDDAVYASSKGDDVLDGGKGSDTLGFQLLEVGVKFSLGEDKTVDTGDGTARVSGFENINGTRFDDRLTGDARANVITGDNAGNDTLAGGGGRDTLGGGADADVFLFDAKSLGRANEAAVLDFEAGEDLIDLSKIDADATAAGNQAFSFIGETAFSGAAGELRIASTDLGARLFGDLNGDGKADFFVELRFPSGAIGAGDFDL